MPTPDDLIRMDATIAAIATPPGDGGVAIVRIAGPDAIQIASPLFSGPVSKYTSHTLHYGVLKDLEGHPIDHVLLTVMRAPKSYTGDDTVEIHCHGGSLITRSVLNAALSAGARAARPGEFTMRAFLNGKLDLAQAEAVQALIGAKNEHALNAADNQLQGRLSKEVKIHQNTFTRIAAILEAWVDFPEEGLEFASHEELLSDLTKALKQLEMLISTFHEGRLIQEGISLCLAGAPNVGKSSLMNALLQTERAIVSPHAGTTRDTIEASMRLNGLHVRLIDTAGIRNSEEAIEQEGIRRSQIAIQNSDLILLVLDASRSLNDDEKDLIQKLPKEKTVAIWNKIDLVSPSIVLECPFPHTVSISATCMQGIDILHQAIDKILWAGSPPHSDAVLITNVRHYEALLDCANACKAAILGLEKGLSPEFLALEMRSALIALGRILGTDVTEDILTQIFSTFCIGK